MGPQAAQTLEMQVLYNIRLINYQEHVFELNADKDYVPFLTDNQAYIRNWI